MNNADTLSQLRSGKLAGATSLNLRSCDLTELPREVFDLADTLEVLDLGQNRLSDLPDDLARLKQLRVLFCTDNAFRHVPAVTGRCENLSMLAFKSCQVETIDPAAFPPSLRWLILTDNRIGELPSSLGNCARLQKLMLAGNRLADLPESLAACQNLELVRLSANQFTRLPAWLLELPRLSWLAISSNPCTARSSDAPALESIDWKDLTLGAKLGEGASGVISQAVWRHDGKATPVAVKMFKAEMTSDGLPASEMAACMAAGNHEHLIPVRGRITGHPENAQGVVMALIDPVFHTLAGPPSLASCTRDVYEESLRMEPAVVRRVASGVAAAARHLHQRGMVHGDLYAHNVQWNPATGEALLGDFGAAAYVGAMDTPTRHALERLEVGAWGMLLGELLDRALPDDGALDDLRALRERCCDPVVADRPDFAGVVAGLAAVRT